MLSVLETLSQRPKVRSSLKGSAIAYPALQSVTDGLGLKGRPGDVLGTRARRDGRRPRHRATQHPEFRCRDGLSRRMATGPLHPPRTVVGKVLPVRERAAGRPEDGQGPAAGPSLL